jgi:predicted metal-dependent peptidase
LTAEQLYADIPDPPAEMRAAFEAGTIPVGQGCGVDDGTDPNGNPDPDDPDGQEAKTPDQLKRDWQECAVQCQMQGRQAGDVAGNMLADILDVPDPLVRWSEVLRGALLRAIAEAGRDDVSWRRRSRRSTVEFILPGGVNYRCKAAVVIDASGSVDDEALARCTAETTAIVNHCGVAVFLVVHDHAVQSATWIRPGVKSKVHQDIKKEMKGRGGTSFDEAYDRVQEEGEKFNVMVHLTDAEIGGVWPPRPSSVRRLVVALVGSACKDNCPPDARVIEVEI